MAGYSDLSNEVVMRTKGGKSKNLGESLLSNILHFVNFITERENIFLKKPLSANECIREISNQKTWFCLNIHMYMISIIQVTRLSLLLVIMASPT